MMNTSEVADVVAPLIESAGLGLYDVEQKGSTLRVSVDSVEGVPFGALERLAREISLALDEVDPISGSYMLEVSTPGVERNLRLPEHFAGAVGEIVTLKTIPGPEGRVRYRGELVSASGDGLVVDDDECGRVEVSVSQVESARTLFEWGPAPKPGKTTEKSQRGASQ